MIISVLVVPLAYSANPYFDSLYGHSVPDGILDGEPKTFVVTGYSTSLYPDQQNNWPIILQRMLDEHAGQEDVYYVYNVARGSSPLAIWTDICSTDNSLIEDVIQEFVDPANHPDIHKGTVPEASVMLAQQSLQYVFDCNDRFNEIEIGYGELPGTEDQAKVEQGANAIEYYASQFLGGGIERVYLATHIYGHPEYYQYELYGERFAMEQALNDVTGLYPGPEVWEVTKALWPDGFTGDQRHPDIEVAHAMALYWYIVLAGNDAKQEVMQPIADVAGVPIPTGGTPSPNPTPTVTPSPGPLPTVTSSPSRSTTHRSYMPFIVTENGATDR